MPSWVAHAALGVALASPFAPTKELRRFGWTAAVCTIVPDLDAIGRPFGAGDIELLGGHRGFTHSIAFAVGFGALVAWGAFRGERWDALRMRLWLCFAIVTLSHGLLDGLTTVGQGVMYLSPFSDARYSFEWKPIDPSRIPPGRDAFGRLAGLLAQEVRWVILPSVVFMITVVPRARRRSSSLVR